MWRWKWKWKCKKSESSKQPDILFKKINITLVDFKIEFGRSQTKNISEIIIADEIRPDSCRLWDMSSNEKLDKDRFRRNIGGLIEAYKEVATRLEIDLSDI